MKFDRKNLIHAGVALLWIAVWQLLAYPVNRHLLIPVPTPMSTAAALIRLMADRSFFHAVFLSIGRIVTGFLCAFLVGTVLAVLCVRSEFLHVLTAPLLQLIRAIPVASFTILIFLWVSRERIPTVITFFTVLPVVWANVESGLRAADEGLVEMARVFGMPGSRILREILLPSIRPFFSSAAASGIGFAWKSGVAAEVICRTQDSLGNLLWAGKSAVEYDEVFAVTSVIVGLSVLLQRAAEDVLRGRRVRDGRFGAKAVAGAVVADGGAGATDAEADADAADAGAVVADGGAGATDAEADADAADGRAAVAPEYCVRLRHVSFGYRLRRLIFEDLSMEIRRGDRLYIAGASGSGKTTFLRIVTGLARPRSGSVERTEGVRISAVFQEDRLLPWKSVLDNVLLFAGEEGRGGAEPTAEAASGCGAPGELPRGAGRERERAALRLLAALGLQGCAGLLPGELSGGMKRRVAIARALMHPFDLLVLDEAFTGLDADTKRRCLAVIDRELAGRALLMSTHDPSDAAALKCDRGVNVTGGRPLVTFVDIRCDSR